MKQKKEGKESLKKTKTQQILTRSRVREHNQTKKTNTWLNTAIVIVVVLLGITLYAIAKW